MTTIKLDWPPVFGTDDDKAAYRASREARYAALCARRDIPWRPLYASLGRRDRVLGVG
jgi:hypothetical protein